MIKDGVLLTLSIRVVPAWVSFGITTYLGLCGSTGRQSSMDIDMIRVLPRDTEDQIFVPTGAHVARVREGEGKGRGKLASDREGSGDAIWGLRHRVDEHIEDDTLCRPDVDPTVVEKSIIRHVADDFIDNDDEQLSHQSGSIDDEK
ncbi:uncharacterized protein E5676_scaffold1933G00050 [Cucumis melo var. makuwa]|uniref:Uncharacterized protein n=1 Tax=Cucumis melo var. makuwa TaxID=1194695 RepID=A0A5D3C985_CUCMM|nr:uncharacterized protein E5676_scaffold1933G00050 [Cucumis melo var. makuwa]